VPDLPAIARIDRAVAAVLGDTAASVVFTRSTGAHRIPVPPFPD